jgi:hypothetical protein
MRYTVSEIDALISASVANSPTITYQVAPDPDKPSENYDKAVDKNKIQGVRRPRWVVRKITKNA